MKVTLEHVVGRLEQHALPYATLALGDNIVVVISQRGGRILGPFLMPEGESVLWLNPVFADSDAFAAFLATRGWNLGGERIWVAPEIQYGVRDRSRFWDTLALPPQMDPGNWALHRENGAWALTQELTLEAHNIAYGHKELRIARRIRPTADPLRGLRHYAELLDGVTFAGYEHLVTLEEAQTDAIMSETWNVVQLNPGGQLLIPTTRKVEYSDYFEPVDPAHQRIDERAVRIRITGDRRFKVGYKAAHLFGRLGYLNSLSDGRTYLVVRSFLNNPSAPYIEEPPARVGCRGHSVHVYNDGGMFGGFGELECNGQTIGGVTGRSSSTDPFWLWLYIGPEGRIREIVAHLLGVLLEGTV